MNEWGRNLMTLPKKTLTQSKLPVILCMPHSEFIVHGTQTPDSITKSVKETEMAHFSKHIVAGLLIGVAVLGGASLVEAHS